MRTLYFECASGISGDMTVAALLDLGADEQALRSGLESLRVSGYHIEIGRVNKSGIDACDFNVVLEHDAISNHGDDGHGHDDSNARAHAHSHEFEHTHSHALGADTPEKGDHDHAHWHESGNEYHGHPHAHEEPHNHAHAFGEAGNIEHSHPHPHTHEKPEHEHSHNDAHSHGHTHDNDHEHRNIGDINVIIEASGISRGAKDMAKKIFGVVAVAEARVHGKPVSEVHFHEVGAVDSIVDIVGAAICADSLGVDKIICSPLREGTGTVKCQHGVMPVPAPATLEIIRSHDIPLIITDNKGEMVTPTGAAIIAALAEDYDAPKNVTVKKIGYGAGKRNYKTANVLRAMLLEEDATSGDEVLKIECNLDDMTGEELAYACEMLMLEGALDVWTTPIFMKKGRPGYMLSVLCLPSGEEKMTAILFKHTTTIGVRLSAHARRVMERGEESITTQYGPIPVKTSTYGGIRKSKPEFEAVKKIAGENGASISQITRSAYNG